MSCSTMRGFVIGIALASMLAGTPAATAEVKYWEPADGIGNWNYGPYWDPSGVPAAGDEVRIEANGSGWTLFCNYINATNPLLSSLYIGNFSTGTAEAHLSQSQDALHVGTEYVGYQGTGKHFQSGGSVTIDGGLYLGRLSGSYGYYGLSGGTLWAGYPYVGGSGEGEFVQSGGTFTCTEMRVANPSYAGPYGTGACRMEAGTFTTNLIYLGGKEEGTFEQTGGTVNVLVTGLTLGVDQYGGGHYTLTNGDLNTYRTRVSQAGSTFSQSGGTHDITGNLEVGYGGAVPVEALFTLSGTGIVNVGDDLRVGNAAHSAPGRYRQTGGGAAVTNTVTIADSLGTFKLEGGTFVCDDVHNEGDFEHSGGILSTSMCDNDSAEAMTIEATADCRINTLSGNAGRVWLKDGDLRGTHAGGGTYNRCVFTNDADFTMDGGEFFGDLINNGSFTYNGGVLDESTFTNYGGYGSVYLNARFACRRIVNHGTLAVGSDRRVDVDGLGHPNAFENNGSLNMHPRSEINLYDASTKLVNYGQMYAGGAIPDEAYLLGTLENHGYLIPVSGGLNPGHLHVEGYFAAFSGAELRIRIRGTETDDYDHMHVQLHADLAGELDVRLTEGFVPVAGDRFTVVSYGSHSGEFDPVYLPTLPAGLEWELTYGRNGVALRVVEEPSVYYGDMDCDEDVDMNDVPLFVQALVDPDDFGGCDIMRGDMNEDTLVNGADVQGFIAVLIGD